MAENKNRGAAIIGYVIGAFLVLAIAGSCEEEKDDRPSTGMTTRWERMEMARGEWRD